MSLPDHLFVLYSPADFMKIYAKYAKAFAAKNTATGKNYVTGVNFTGT